MLLPPRQGFADVLQVVCTECRMVIAPLTNARRAARRIALHLISSPPEYEPKFCVDANDKHTPINLPNSNGIFPHDCNATIAATSKEPDVPLHSGAYSSSKHTAAANYLWKQLADDESVDSRNSIGETGADLDRDTSVSTLLRTESRGKRDRDQNVVQSLRDREHLHQILERKAESAVRGEGMAQQKWYEAEAEVEAGYWEKRNSDRALHEIKQDFESQRFQQQQANRWADQAHSDEISLYGELELRNRLFQENHARGCQEIEELRRICCEETDRARRARIDELSTHHENNPTTVSQLLTQIQELQNKVDSLSDAREFFTILNQSPVNSPLF